MSGELFPVRWSGHVATVRVPAEIDLTVADELRETLLAVLNQDALALIVDMTATTFCDSAGVRALARAARRADAGGATFRVASSTQAVVRLFSLIGVDRMIGVCPDVSAAMESLPRQASDG